MRRGTALTIVLWLVSLGLHFGYDALAFHGAEAAKFSAATMDLYFAVSLAVQRPVLYARARRRRDTGAGAARHPVSSRAGW